MKKAIFIVLGALALTFSSCTEENHDPLETAQIEVRSEKSECDDFEKQINAFIPDTEEEFQYFKDLKDPNNVSKQEVEKFTKLMGFKDSESLSKFIAELSKSDCMDKLNSSEIESKRGNCGFALLGCVVDAILDFGSTDILPYELANFISDIFDCVEDFNDCNQ